MTTVGKLIQGRPVFAVQRTALVLEAARRFLGGKGALQKRVGLCVDEGRVS